MKWISIAGLTAFVAAGTSVAASSRESQATPSEQTQTVARTQVDRSTIDRIIASWKPGPKKAAGEIIAKYGLPHEATASRLIWHGNGPWKLTELVNEEIDHNFPVPHKDMLYQAINYDVDPDNADDILRFDGSVILERTKGEIAARCDKEAANFLAINLAEDVANGKRSVDDARRYYADSIAQMMKSGTPNDYMKRFTFDVARRNVGDADERFMMQRTGEAESRATRGGQQSTRGQMPATSGTRAGGEGQQAVTMAGCLYRERDVPGRTPNVAERAGVLEDYILVGARPARQSETAGTSGAPSTPSSGWMFKVENIDDERLQGLVGKRVEVTGTIDKEPGDVGPRATGTAGASADESVGPDRLELAEFEATSIREVSGPACPATPPRQ